MAEQRTSTLVAAHFCAALLLLAGVNGASAAGSPTDAAEQSATASLFDLSFDAIDRSPMPLAQYEGRPILLVNTASLCGFTPQYDGLQAVWEKYRDQGLVVIGAPSNDFGGQEPGSNGEIKKFCETNFNISFPLTDKVDVTGADAHPVFQWAKRSFGAAAEPKWNFHKILIGRDGAVAAAFPSSVEPGSERLTRAIESALSTTERNQ